MKGHKSIVTGTESELVAAGLVRPEWFPGKPGNNRVTQNVSLDQPAPVLLPGISGGLMFVAHRVKIRRKNSRMFVVWMTPETANIAARHMPQSHLRASADSWAHEAMNAAAARTGVRLKGR
ncbi:MAG: hypothetical protein ACT4P0_02295 [Panacagrimonas sp.]